MITLTYPNYTTEFTTEEHVDGMCPNCRKWEYLWRKDCDFYEWHLIENKEENIDISFD